MNQKPDRFDKFTEQAKAALVAAQREAQRRGMPLIEPEHLILAIISDSTGMAVNILRALGVEPETIYAAVEASLQPVADIEFGEKPRLSPRTQQALGAAVAEMVRLQRNDLATGHLLLGLLCEERGNALLNTSGVHLDTARAAMEHAYNQAPAIEQPAERIDHVSDLPDAWPESAQLANSVQIDSARQEQAIAFARSRQRAQRIYGRVIVAIAGLLTLLALLSPQLPDWFSSLASTLTNAPVLNWQPIASWSPLLVLITYLLIVISLLIISLPLSWYTSFILPRRHGLRKGTALDWWKQIGKSLLVIVAEIWLLVELSTLLQVVQPQSWWAWTGLAQFLFSILMVRFGPVWLQPRLNKIEALAEGEITGLLSALRARLQIPECDIYLLKVSHRTNAANAIFTGVGRGRRILLTDTLLQNFTPDEIEVILAHELAHLVHHDIWTRLVMRGLIFLGVFYLIDTYFASLALLASGSDLTVPLTLLQTLLPLLLLILLLIFVNLVMRYRRYQEYQADEFALQVTGNIQAFKEAMTRLTNLGMTVVTSAKHARHPASHPTLLKRLKHADEFAERYAHS